MSGRDYLGEFEQVVLLALVRHEGPAYGGSIHQEILDATGRDVSIPAVYVTLKRMEKKGLVSSRVAALSPGDRATRNYTIQPDGRDALERSRQMLEQLWAGRDARPADGSAR